MQKLEGFTWATVLDLNMEHYHIRLDPDAQKICTIVFRLGKYQYLCLPIPLRPHWTKNVQSEVRGSFPLRKLTPQTISRNNSDGY